LNITKKCIFIIFLDLFVIEIQYWSIDVEYRIYLTKLRNKLNRGGQFY